MTTLPLVHLPSLHWLWIRLLIACRSGRVALALLRLWGALRWLLRPGQRRQITRHYQHLALIARETGHKGPLTELPPATLARRHFIHRAILGAAPALVSSAPPAFHNGFVKTTAIETFSDSGTAADEKGTVIAGTHFGALGIAPAILSSEGRRVLLLRDQQFSPLVATRHGKQFFLGAEPLFLNSKDPGSVNRALLKCARALGDGAIVAYTADASHGSRYIECTLFGRKVQIRTALVEVAMRTGSCAAFGFSYVKDGFVYLDLSPPVRLHNNESLEAWCHDFCRRWEQLMVFQPEDISWHKSDLALLAVPPQQNT